MNIDLLDLNVQKFIEANLNTDINKLALTKNPFPGIVWSDIINQIAAKQKAKNKLPTWFATKNIIYPSKLSIEQTSSEATAQYKANLIAGNSLIDLTGGFGIDDFYFAKQFKEVVHCELNAELSKIVAQNALVLNAENINCIAGDSTDILKKLNRKFDWIYVDPSRRNDLKGKVFMLKDCLPNVPELLDFYFEFSDSILIKNSPILDISLAISELKNVKKVYIIALDNEVKEFLIEIKKDYSEKIILKTINLSKNNNQVFEHIIEDDSSTSYSLPKQFVYEPNAAIMKSGLFNSVANQLNLFKLHQHSHIYTSDVLIENFPGRSFKVDHFFEFNKQNANQFLKGQKMNVTTRNFNLTVDELKKKFKISDGGFIYTFATTTINNQKTILICTKI